MSGKCFGQTTKDSIIYKADSVNTISVKDMVDYLKTMEDKLTKKQYDEVQGSFILLLQYTEKKRILKIVKK
jgi:hypothetical protein